MKQLLSRANGTLGVNIALAISGCSKLTSIDRATTTSVNKAIHLDAKQRVVMSKDQGKILCAEPSPDALSAFASCLSGSASATGQGAASLAFALSEGAGSIGLRTQTITLLRDYYVPRLRIIVQRQALTRHGRAIG